jgi:hypothetical protein
MTPLHKTGDKGNALCETCQEKVATTYQQRNVPLSDGSLMVPNVLVGVCDTCDNITTLPHQSVQRVAELTRNKS